MAIIDHIQHSAATVLRSIGSDYKDSAGITVTVTELSTDGYISRCVGTTPPTTAAGTYANGCVFIDTNGGSGLTLLVNEGTTASPSFVPVSTVKSVSTSLATIATTGNTDAYLIVPETGTLSAAYFSGIDALATNDTNYLTFTLTNLGQAGAGSTVMLAATAANTTKATGGTALVANGKRTLTLSGTAANLAVTAGDRLLFRAAASGTLANTVTVPIVMLRIK